MIELLRQFGRREEVLGFLDRTLENNFLQEQCHGVALSLDPYWLFWARVRAVGYYGYFCLDSSFAGGGVYQVGLLNQMINQRKDDHWLPPNWEAHCQLHHYPFNAAPIIIKFIMRSLGFDLKKYNLPVTMESRLGVHPVVYEYRPICVAVRRTMTSSALAPSASVGRLKPAHTGTLGGFIKNAITSEIYGVSCAHVLGPSGTDIVFPGPATKTTRSVVGQVLLDVLPPPQGGSRSCNNSVSVGQNLDLSICSIDLGVATPQISPGYPSSIQQIAQMGTGDLVRFSGQKSGRVRAQIDDLNLSRSIVIDNVPHCFGDLFSIVPRRPVYINTALAKAGDSGSWVTYDSARLPALAGMVIADDGMKAYCCFAENMVNRISQHFGTVGSCVLA